jgi:NADH dehydrogenase FAD-containing subunit
MKRIAIIGAWFGGLAAPKALRHAKAEIWVIDRASHNLFQPLLYQVATTVLSPAQIASPIREGRASGASSTSGCMRCRHEVAPVRSVQNSTRVRSWVT